MIVFRTPSDISSGQIHRCRAECHDTLLLVQLRPGELVVPTYRGQAGSRALCQWSTGQWTHREILAEPQ